MTFSIENHFESMDTNEQKPNCNARINNRFLSALNYFINATCFCFLITGLLINYSPAQSPTSFEVSCHEVFHMSCHQASVLSLKNVGPHSEISASFWFTVLYMDRHTADTFLHFSINDYYNAVISQFTIHVLFVRFQKKSSENLAVYLICRNVTVYLPKAMFL